MKNKGYYLFKVFLVTLFVTLGCASNKSLVNRVSILESKLARLEYGDAFAKKDVSIVGTLTNPSYLPYYDFDGWNFSEKYYCPECQRAGLESKVYRGIVSRTVAGIVDYYDESGFHVYNDPNITTTEWSCSNGHTWTTRE